MGHIYGLSARKGLTDAPQNNHLDTPRDAHTPLQRFPTLPLTQLLADVVLAVKESKGCKNYVRVSEGLARLGDMPGGVDTRWLYWVYTCMWLAPTTRRLELIVCCLLHEWRCAQGDEGLFADAEQTDEFGETKYKTK